MEPVRLRDTRSFYLDAAAEQFVAPGHLAFVRERAGEQLLDYGCATGGYCLALTEAGYRCTGVDVNAAYIDLAKRRGVDAHLIGPDEQLPFSDASFETVLLFEVLEHVPEYQSVLREAKRVARQNVLITVPNCGSNPALQRASLVFDHMLEVDHVNFFTRSELEAVLAQLFTSYDVREEEPKDTALYQLIFPRLVAASLALLTQSGVTKRKFSYRLFAEARV
jgi:ubiquinone/menaquinone biosynthesis C-methylase UbiE